MNPRQMKQAMKKLGMEQIEIDDAIAVVIRTKSKDIIIRNPQISKINMMGTWTYQISGDEQTRDVEAKEPEISEEDIKTVVEKTGASEAHAKEILEKTGDLAETILELSS